MADAELRIQMLADDPLQAARDARELHAELMRLGAAARIERPARTTDPSRAKGVTVDVVALVLAAAGNVLAAMQIWLSRVPARRIRIERADGATLEITGAQAKDEPRIVERFLESS